MMERTLKILNQIKLGVNSVTQSYYKIGGWRSIPVIIGLAALIGVPVAFALGAEAGAVILLSSITIALASALTSGLIGLVDKVRKERYEKILGSQYYNNLTPNNNILASSISADPSGKPGSSQSVPVPRENSIQGLISFFSK